MKSKPILRLIPLLAAFIALAAPAAAEPREHRSTYVASILGLPIANMSFLTRIDDRSYKISGELKTAFVAEIIDPTRGSVSAEGRMRGSRLQPSAFVLEYKSGDKRYRSRMTLAGGNVRSATVEPKKSPPPSWVPVTAAQKRAVLDPLSSMVIPSGQQVCPRKLPIFDGESRIDLALSKKGVRPYSTKGFSGEAIVCSVRFIPRGGYRKNNSSIEYLRKADSMEVWFAQHPSAGYFAPVYAKVPTKIGTLTVAATRYGG